MAVKIYFKKFNSIYTLYVIKKSYSLRQHSSVIFIYDPCYVSEKQCCTLRGKKNGEREYQEKKKKNHKNIQTSFQWGIGWVSEWNQASLHGEMEVAVRSEWVSEWVSRSRSVVSNSLRPHGPYSPWSSVLTSAYGAFTTSRLLRGIRDTVMTNTQTLPSPSPSEKYTFQEEQ